jgi:hypothetical protein
MRLAHALNGMRCIVERPAREGRAGPSHRDKVAPWMATHHLNDAGNALNGMRCIVERPAK